MKLWKTETFFFGAVLAWLSQSHSYSQKKQALPLSSEQQGPVHYQKGCGSSSLTEDTANQTPIQHRMKLNLSLGLSRSHCPPILLSKTPRKPVSLYLFTRAASCQSSMQSIQRLFNMLVTSGITKGVWKPNQGLGKWFSPSTYVQIPTTHVKMHAYNPSTVGGDRTAGSDWLPA